MLHILWIVILFALRKGSPPWKITYWSLLLPKHQLPTLAKLKFPKERKIFLSQAALYKNLGTAKLLPLDLTGPLVLHHRSALNNWTPMKLKLNMRVAAEINGINSWFLSGRSHREINLVAESWNVNLISKTLPLMDCLGGKKQAGKSAVFPLQSPIDFSSSAHEKYA